MATMRPVKVGSMAPGLNNRLEPTDLKKQMPDGSTGTYLYAADNVDLDKKGYVKRRKGTTTLMSGIAHSLWGDDQGAYVVYGTDLRRVNAGAEGMVALSATIREGLPKLPISYSRGADGDVYWSNGFMIRRITAGDIDTAIATPPLNPAPYVTYGPGGSLPEGQYLLAFTAGSVDGESPATPVIRVDVPKGGVITVQGTQEMNIYMSAPNGDVLTFQQTGTVENLVTFTQDGRRCATLNKAVLPPGEIVRHYRGCMLVAKGPLLLIGDPYNYGLFDPSAGYIPFPSAISVIEPVDNGVYICADKTYWISDLTSGDLQELLPHGAIPGTSGRSPDSETVFWNSPSGIVIGDKNSSVKTVQDEAMIFSQAAFGATLYRERDGMRHLVASRSAPSPSTAVASSWMEARVIQKGTVV